MMISETLYAIVWIGRFNPLGEIWNSAQLTRNTIMRDRLWNFNWEPLIPPGGKPLNLGYILIFSLVDLLNKKFFKGMGIETSAVAPTSLSLVSDNTVRWDIVPAAGEFRLKVIVECYKGNTKTGVIFIEEVSMTNKIPGNLLTTTMAVMPHTDVAHALEKALSLDVPFWPQLPNYSYYEDMYVQAAEHFPGIILDLDVLSLGVYTNAEIFAAYATAIGKFLDRGGVIVWGIVPTGFEAFAQEETPSLSQRLEGVWKILWSKGIDREQLIARCMLSPATCCLVNPDKERTVERAFAAVNRMAEVLRVKYL